MRSTQTRFLCPLTRRKEPGSWGSMTETDIQALRSLGLGDEQIPSLVLITCAFNLFTCLADGLGVDVLPERQKPIEKWLTDPGAGQDWLMRPKG